MNFLNQLIKDFRPRLAPEGGLQPLSQEAVRRMELDAAAQKQFIDEKDNVFLTQEQKDAAAHTGGAALDGVPDGVDDFK